MYYSFMKKIYLLPLIAIGLIACNDEMAEQPKSEILEKSLTEEDFERFNLEALKSSKHTISAEQAELEALKLMENFNSNNGLKSASSVKVANVRVVGPKHRLKSASNDTLAYIVNFADNHGYAYVCADNRLNSSVLAFFDKGSYSENMNPTAKFMFDKTEEYIHRTITEFEVNKEVLEKKYGELSGTTNQRTLKSTKKVAQVKPLLSTHWGQGNPYNYYCPKCKSCSNKALTGCMNTALAQVMFYYKWPDKITLDNGIVCNLQWEKCDKKNYSGADGVLAHNMMEIGKALQSVYGCKSHGGTQTYQKLSENLIAQKLKYSCMDWDYTWSSTKDFIDNGHPMLLMGFTSPSSSSGHAWVVDGYYIENHYFFGKKTSSTTYVHNNWGYGGDNDGYFEKNCFNSKKQESYDFGRNSSYYADYSYNVKMRWLFPVR